LTGAFGRLVVVIVGGVALTTIDSGLVATLDKVSVTCTVNELVPFTVGVPLITPVAELMPRPVGREPAEMLHV